MRGIEVQRVQAGEVEIGTVHDVEGAGFRCHDVEDVDIMEFSFGDVDESRYVSAQVEECVQFDGCLGLSEPRPWEEGQAQVYGRGIECIDGIVEVEAVVVFMVQGPCLVDQLLCEGGIEPPIPDGVGVGECVSCHAAADAHVVEFVGPGTQTGFDVAQARAIGELSERHAPVLIGTGE